MPDMSPHDIASAFLSGASGNKAATFGELASLLLQEFDRCGYAVVPKEPTSKMLFATPTWRDDVSYGTLWREMIAVWQRECSE